MLNRKAFIGIVAVMCCAQAALGAASVRSFGMQGVGDNTSARAGSLRTVPTKTVSAAPRASVSTPVEMPVAGRIATSTGGATLGTKPNRIGKQSSIASAALEDLERRINELTNNYESLGNQYAQLSMGVSDATATALNAKSTSDSNTEQIALKMNTADFNSKFDTRAAGLASKSYVQTYVSENAPTPDLTGYYTSTEVENRLASKVGVGDDFNSAFDSRLEAKGVENNVSELNRRVTTIEENPGVNTDAVNNLINTSVAGLRTEVTTGLSNTLQSAKDYADSVHGMNADERAAFNNLSGNVTTLATQMGAKLDSSVAANTYATKEQLDQIGSPDLSEYAKNQTVNALAERVGSTETAIQTHTSALADKVDTETLSGIVGQMNNALNNKADKTDLHFLCDDPEFGVNTVVVNDVPKSRVTVSCNGVQKGSFDIATSDGNGGGGVVCGVALDTTQLKGDQSDPDKITGYKLQFKDTCTNEQVGEDVIVNSGADGIAGDDGCPTIVTATKDGTTTTLKGTNSCTQAVEWTTAVNDGTAGTPGDSCSIERNEETNAGREVDIKCGNNTTTLEIPKGDSACAPLVQTESLTVGEKACKRIKVTPQIKGGDNQCTSTGQESTYSGNICDGDTPTVDFVEGENGEIHPTTTVGGTTEVHTDVNLRGPQGIQGAEGPQGPQGPGVCAEGEVLKLEQVEDNNSVVRLVCDAA